MSERVLVFGADGLVGSRFIELYSDKEALRTPDIHELNILSLPKLRQFFKQYAPQVVVNFAAFTDVGAAETQRGDKSGDCWQVNVEGVRNIVETLDPRLVHYIHISTDMVFPGDSDIPGPYSESHPPGEDESRLTWYGFSKAEGERIVNAVLGKRATILRIIYPVRAHFKGKLDYLQKPLSLYDQGKLYPLFDDQQISITFIDEACQALNRIIDGSHTGIFHASSKDTTTPFELVTYLLETVRGLKHEIKSQSLVSSVRYPKFGGLRVEQTEKELGIKFSTWREIVDKLAPQLVL